MKMTLALRRDVIRELNIAGDGEQRYSFESLDLFLNKDVLVPHPDTLKLVSIAREVLQKNKQIKIVADVGTGSGVIAIMLGKTFPDLHFIASDNSQAALDLALKNILVNNINNVDCLYNQDSVWLSEFGQTSVDMIISNPPFVGLEEYTSNEFNYLYPEVSLEPRQAILARDKYGFEPYIEILRNSAKTGVAMYLFQCNSLYMKKLKTLIFEEFPHYSIHSMCGQSGEGRYLFIRK